MSRDQKEIKNSKTKSEKQKQEAKLEDPTNTYGNQSNPGLLPELSTKANEEQASKIIQDAWQIHIEPHQTQYKQSEPPTKAAPIPCKDIPHTRRL